MKRYGTLNSEYEVASIVANRVGPRKAIRRVTGTGPSPLPVPDGAWLFADEVTVMQRARLVPPVLAVVWTEADGRRNGFFSSAIVWTEETFKGEGVETPLEADTSSGSRYCTAVRPPEVCEEEALPGSDLCARHDPDAHERD